MVVQVDLKKLLTHGGIRVDLRSKWDERCDGVTVNSVRRRSMCRWAGGRELVPSLWGLYLCNERRFPARRNFRVIILMRLMSNEDRVLSIAGTCSLRFDALSA